MDGCVMPAVDANGGGPWRPHSTPGRPPRGWPRRGVGGPPAPARPGMGTPRRLAEARGRAQALGLAVAPGAGIELDRAAPLRSLRCALRAARPRPVDLAALTEHTADRMWYVDRLGDALEEYAAHQPLLVLLDDAHWCDELSALALRVLVSRLSSSPLRWLLARRTVPVCPGQDAIDWLVANGAQETRLRPLGDDAAQELCARVLGATPDATVLALAAGGRGNPFLLVHYLAALKAAGQILVHGGVASVVGGDLPSSFLSAVGQRLRGLSGEALRLLQAGSVFRRPFAMHQAARLIGINAAAVVPAAEETVAAGILIERGTALAFQHDLLRQAVYDNLPGPVRATMHREAAAVVQAEGSAPAEVAEHLVRAGPRGQRAALDVLRAAAEGVAADAPSAAADMLVHALRLLPGDDPQRSGLKATAVGLLAAAGRVAEALELGESTLRGEVDVRTRATVLLGLAEALKHAGQNQAAADYARRALAEPGVVPAAVPLLQRDPADRPGPARRGGGRRRGRGTHRRATDRGGAVRTAARPARPALGAAGRPGHRAGAPGPDEPPVRRGDPPRARGRGPVDPGCPGGHP